MQDHPLVWPFFHFSRSGPRPDPVLPPDDTVSAGSDRSVPNPRGACQDTGRPVSTFSPCPFCHGTDLASHKPGAGLFWAVFCENGECGATGPLGLTEAEAVRGWNTRRDGRTRPGLAELLGELADAVPDLAESLGHRLRSAADGVLEEPYVPQPGLDALEYVQGRLRERLSRELRDFLDEFRPLDGSAAPTGPFDEIWPAPKCGPAPTQTEDSE